MSLTSFLSSSCMYPCQLSVCYCHFALASFIDLYSFPYSSVKLFCFHCCACLFWHFLGKASFCLSFLLYSLAPLNFLRFHLLLPIRVPVVLQVRLSVFCILILSSGACLKIASAIVFTSSLRCSTSPGEWQSHIVINLRTPRPVLDPSD